MLQIIRVTNHTRVKSYALQIIRVWNHTRMKWRHFIGRSATHPCLTKPSQRTSYCFASRRALRDVAVMRSWRNDSRAVIHVCRQSNVLICTTDSTVSQPTVDTRSLSPKFAHQSWYVAQTNARLWCFVNAASHECCPSWMTSQWSALTNQRPLFHTRYFCYTIEMFHGTFHTCMNSYVEDFKSFTEHFIRVWFHTSKIS